ncbi:hypothetical protein [Haloarchaeobius sp. DFWS5]|uniref:hypothetical protein n=1 Tax=Haloarchaeobius sp. DFWS5 TaxID=3446114 RepID=UPI003EC0F906
MTYWRERGNERKRRAFASLSTHADVVWLDPERVHTDVQTMDLDLLHVAKRRPESLATLELAATHGVPTVNPPSAVRLASDRVDRHSVLFAASVPVPKVEYGPATACSLDPPVLVKSRSEGVPGSHDHEFVGTGPLAYTGHQFVESYVPHSESVKVHVLGDESRAVRDEVCRTDGARSDGGSGWTPTRLDDAVAGLVERVRDVLDLRVFELDVVRTEADEWVVVDVNPVVSLAGVPDAVSLYSDFLRVCLAKPAPARRVS